MALVADLPELGLLAGEVGSVVERLGGDVFEVEFVNEAGRTYGLYTLEAWQLLRLHSQGLALKILNEYFVRKSSPPNPAVPGATVPFRSKRGGALFKT